MPLDVTESTGASATSDGTGGGLHLLEVVIGPFPESLGGVGTMVLTLIDGLRAMGHGVTVFVPADWDVAALKHRNWRGIDVYSLRLRLPFAGKRPLRHFAAWCIEGPRTLWRLRRLCRRHGIQLVHIHTATNYVFYFRLLRLIGGPRYVVTYHRGDVVDYPVRSAMDRALIRFGIEGAAATTAVAEWLNVAARATFPAAPPATTIHNGFRPGPTVASPSAGRWLERVGDAPFFLTVGCLDPYKGHEVAIRAWKSVREQGHDAHLLVAGEGDLRDALGSLIRETGGEGRVHLLGHVPHADVLALMSRARGLVFPSRSEGFSYALLEAGTSGLAAVCSDIPSFAEIIADGDNGMLFPVDDPAALAAAVGRLLDNPELAPRLGARLAATVAARFSSDEMTRRYVDFFRTALAPPPRPAAGWPAESASR